MDTETAKDVKKIDRVEREYREELEGELRMDPLILNPDLHRNIIKQIHERNILMNQGN